MYNNELKSLGNVEVKEFMLSKDGYNLIGFLGKGTHYNWLSLPQLCISVELSDFHDDFWNTEQLASSLDDECECESLSRQLIQFENDLFPSKMTQEDLDDDRLHYYIYSREQYGTDAFQASVPFLSNG